MSGRASVCWIPAALATARRPICHNIWGFRAAEAREMLRRRGTESAHQPSVQPRAGRLLVVDDEPAILFALSEYFRLNGWVVDAAAEKGEAEALLASTDYAVVIADLRLTGLYGVEGLDIIQRSRRLRPQARVVVLTGNGTPELEAEARRRGADAFLHKPLPLVNLEAVVESLSPEEP